MFKEILNETRKITEDNYDSLQELIIDLSELSGEFDEADYAKYISRMLQVADKAEVAQELAILVSENDGWGILDAIWMSKALRINILQLIKIK